MTYPPQITFCKLDLNQRRLQLFQRSIGTYLLHVLCMYCKQVNLLAYIRVFIFQLVCLQLMSFQLTSFQPKLFLACVFLSYVFQLMSFYVLVSLLLGFLLQLMSFQRRLLLNSEVLQIQIYPIQITGSMAKKLTPRCPGQP